VPNGGMARLAAPAAAGEKTSPCGVSWMAQSGGAVLTTLSSARRAHRSKTARLSRRRHPHLKTSSGRGGTWSVNWRTPKSWSLSGNSLLYRSMKINTRPQFHWRQHRVFTRIRGEMLLSDRSGGWAKHGVRPRLRG